MAVETVMDIPEDAIVSLLSKTVAHHRQVRPASDDMQVDAALVLSEFPSLADFLARCVTYPASPGALRAAIRAHLADTDGLLPVIGLLDEWIGHGCAEDSSFFDLASMQKRNTQPASQQADIPPLDKVCIASFRIGRRLLTESHPQVLAFVQALLDASFLTLLAYPPAHAVLRTLASHLQPAITLHDTLAQLSGPLQPFAAAHARAARDAAQGAPKADTRIDWRRRKRAANERAELALGLYQVEELVL